MERDVSWTNYVNNRAILTNLTPPSDCKMILVSVRQEEFEAWIPVAPLDYAIWNAFTAVNATTAVAVSNRYNFLTGTDG